MSKYDNVFGDIPLGRPLDRGVEHSIELDIGTQPIKIQPYRHPKRIQDEIDETIKVLPHSKGFK